MNNNPNKSIISVLILSIISISLIVGCISPVRAEDDATGFTIKSITPSHIITNSESLKTANFTLNLVANGGGQYAVGNFGNESFKDYITNIIIKDPLKIEIGGIKEKLTYPILNQGMLFKYEYHYIDAPGFFEGAKCDGSSFCFPTNTDRWGTEPDRILAINRIPVGMYGAFGKPDISWSGKMTVTINGIPNSKDIGSGESAGGSINFESITGEWIANAKWVGSLVTGQATPQENLFVPTYRTESKVWKIAPRTYYDAYTKSLAETDTTLNTWKADDYGYLSDYAFIYVCQDPKCSKVLNYINTHNTNLDALTDANEQINYGSSLSSSSEIITKRENSKVAGSVIDTLNRKIASPEIIMLVKASTLNPYISVGAPHIESITAETFNSGNGSGVAYIKVKNIGDAQGTFSAYLTEESGTFTSQSNVESAKITLNKGESGTIIMYINYADNLQDIKKTGIITVYEVNDPSTKNTATKDFIISMESPLICKANEYRIFGNEVYKCNEDGTDEVKTLTCNNGLLNKVNGKYICENPTNGSISNEGSKSLTSGKEEAEKEDPKEDNNNTPFINLLYWLAAFLILTGIFIIANKIRNNEDKISKENINNSLLLAGITTASAYLYIQYIALSQALGLVLWIIVVVILIIVALTNFISFIKLGKILPLKISIAIAVGLFIIITSLSVGTKDVLCGNGLTSWIFSDCKPFNLMDYLFKGT